MFELTGGSVVEQVPIAKSKQLVLFTLVPISEFSFFRSLILWPYIGEQTGQESKC